METSLTTEAPAQLDFRAELHQLIDQIQDEAVLRAALLLLAPQATAPVAEAEPELTPAELAELDRRLAAYDPTKNLPFAEVMNRLMQTQV